MKKENSIYSRHRFMLFFFLFAVFYYVVIANRLVPWEVDDYAIYSFYSVDYSYGFATKLLPGAVFNALFGSHATRENATLFITVLMLVFFAGLAALLEKFLRRVPAKSRDTALFLLLFFLSGAYTFSVYTKTLGLLETFWLLFSLAFFCFLEHKVLCFLTPLLCAAAILVHNSAMISCIVLMAVVLLYRASVAKDRKEQTRFLVVFALSVCVSAALFLFFTLFESDMICSIDEFHRKLLEHGSDCFYYYDYAFFDIYNGERYIPESVGNVDSAFLRMLYVVFYRIKLNAKVLLLKKEIHIISLCCGFSVLLPVLCFFFRFHWQRFRSSRQKLSRFCTLLMMLQFPFTFFTAFLFSEDITRWLTHAFSIAFVFILTVLFYDPEQRDLFLERLKPLRDSVAVKLYFFAYASISVFTIY